jgi:hypothetical protein
MVAPWRFGFVLAFAIAACVPTLGDGARPADSSSTSTGGTELTPAASTSAAPSFVRPTPDPSPTFLVHVVNAGESLTSIARQFGTTARSIAYWNRERYPSLDPDSEAYEPDRIRVGWMLLLIPTAVVDEDDLADPTPTPAPASRSPDPSGSPS